MKAFGVLDCPETFRSPVAKWNHSHGWPPFRVSNSKTTPAPQSFLKIARDYRSLTSTYAAVPRFMRTCKGWNYQTRRAISQACSSTTYILLSVLPERNDNLEGRGPTDREVSIKLLRVSDIEFTAVVARVCNQSRQRSKHKTDAYRRGRDIGTATVVSSQRRKAGRGAKPGRFRRLQRSP
jgi:hypothetical protein